MKAYGGYLELSRATLAHNLAGVERLVAPAHALPNVDVWEYQEDMRRVYAATRTLKRMAVSPRP